jgi:hypothetical protein
MSTPRKTPALVKAPLPALPRSIEAVMPAIDQFVASDEFEELLGNYGPAVTVFIRPEITQAQRADLRQAWPQLARPATAHEIATQIGQLLAVFPNLAHAEARQLARVVAEDISAEQPSIYEITTACRNTRKRKEFFSEAALMRELKWARRQSIIYRYLAAVGPPDPVTTFVENHQRRMAQLRDEPQDEPEGE